MLISYAGLPYGGPALAEGVIENHRKRGERKRLRKKVRKKKRKKDRREGRKVKKIK